MTHAPDTTRSFDAVWPRDAAAFLHLLQATSLPGAEEDHAVTVVGVVLARSFLPLVDRLESVDALRALLEIASNEPLDLPFCHRLVGAMLAETRAFPGLSARTLAQVDAVAAAHETETAPADWRVLRKAILALADETPGSIDAKALDVIGAMAWPIRAAAKTAGDVIGLLCKTRADIAVDEAGIEKTDRETIMALVRPLAVEQDAAEAAGAPQRSLNDIFDERYPEIAQRVKIQWDFHDAAARKVATRILHASLRG